MAVATAAAVINNEARESRLSRRAGCSSAVPYLSGGYRQERGAARRPLEHFPHVVFTVPEQVEPRSERAKFPLLVVAPPDACPSVSARLG
ncbi:unnamed protein product [Lampetra fluviatilis]